MACECVHFTVQYSVLYLEGVVYARQCTYMWLTYYDGAILGGGDEVVQLRAEQCTGAEEKDKEREEK